MCFSNVLVYFLTIIHIVNRTQSMSLTCMPAEEGKEARMNVTWAYKEKVTLRKGDTNVAICQSNVECIFFQPFAYATISQEQRGLFTDSGIEWLTIKISNATNKGENPTSGIWTLSLVGKTQFAQTNCTVYKKSNDVDCIYETRDQKLVATCNTSGIFPGAKCSFSLNKQMKNKDIQINYVHEQDTFNNFKTVCSAVLDLDNVSTDKRILNATVYPNISGSEDDMAYGTNKIIISDLINNTLSCSPVEEGEKSIVRVRWDTFLPVTLYKDGAIILNCPSSKKCSVHFSFQFTETRKSMGGRSEMDIYIPISTRSIGSPTAGLWTLHLIGQVKNFQRNCSIYSKAKDVECRSDTRPDGVTLICSTSLIYPQPKCIFVSKHKNAAETVKYTKHIKSEYRLINSEPVYYNGTCSLHIPWRDLRLDHLISAIMYPDVTGTEIDIEYGVETPIYVVDVLVLSLNNCLHRLERGQNASCVCDSTSVQVSWFDEETQDVISPVAHLSYTVTRYNAFRCQPSVKELYVGISETYRPNVTYPPVVRKSGDSNRTPSDAPISIECETEGLDDQLMEIVQRDHEINWLIDEYKMRTESNRGLCVGSVYYECVIFDHKLNQTEPMNRQVPCPDDSSSYNIVLIITFAGVGSLAVLVIIIIVLAVYCRKRKGKTSESEFSYQSGLKYDNDFYTRFEAPTESTRTSIYIQYL